MNQIPRNLETIRTFTFALKRNYNNLPENIRNKLLSEIFKKISEKTKSLFFYKLYLFFNNLKENYYKKHINFTHNFDEKIKSELFRKEIKNKINNNIYNKVKLNNNLNII